MTTTDTSSIILMLISIMGFSSKLIYKDFDFGFTLRASVGNFVYNDVAADGANVGQSGVWSTSGFLCKQTTIGIRNQFLWVAPTGISLIIMFRMHWFTLRQYHFGLFIQEIVQCNSEWTSLCNSTESFCYNQI